MSAMKIAENIYWVGVIDWDVRNFHGYLTPYGTTYNAYLVLDEKVTLIDTVRRPFAPELLQNISEVIDPAQIDYFICNHVEPDHSGSIPAFFEACPDAKIIATQNGRKELEAYYFDVNLFEKPDRCQVVKMGDTLCTGQYTFQFVPMPMVHWPDSMATYLPGPNILFSNDALGQHVASNERFDDEIGRERLMERAGDYYANIVLPFDRPVQTLLGAASKLDVSLVAPSHGVMLRGFIADIVEAYGRWARHETDPNRAVVIYDSMWGSTRVLAERLVDKYEREGKTVELLSLSDNHVSTCMAKLLDVGTVAVGCPTLNRQVLPTMAAFLSYLSGLNPKNRKGQAFGSYGWSGESVGMIDSALKALGWDCGEPIRCLWRPRGDESGLPTSPEDERKLATSGTIR